MQIWPAIDLKDGKAVRLLQGRMENSTIYSENPLDVARDFYRQGAEYLHIVDLDGAFAGKPINDEIIRKIVKEVPLQTEVGGGIRSLERIKELLELGVKRVILGTAAVKNPELVEAAVNNFGEQIIVGIDAQQSKVAVQGWAENTEITVQELALAMKKAGVQRIVYTDISRDGMLKGPNIESIVNLAHATGMKVIASGGVSQLEDIRLLCEEAKKGAAIEGVIVGKALYTEAFTLKEALELSGSGGLKCLQKE